MKLEPTQRQTDLLLPRLLRPIIEIEKLGQGWRTINWDWEQGICFTLQKGETVLLIEAEERNPRLECYAHTRRLNVCARHLFDATRPLGGEERAIVMLVTGLLQAVEQHLPSGPRPATSRRNLVREILVERVLMPEGPGHYYINPYVGCMIGCPFCYVAERADFSRRLEGQPSLPWGYYLDVKVNAAQVLREELPRHEPGFVRMSPIITDPYQPVERKYRITRQCLELLREYGYTPLILTRAARVLEDIELLASFPQASVGFSIPTDQDHYRQLLEPGGDPIPERIAALKALHEAGVHTFAIIQPVFPMDPANLVREIAPYIRAVRIDRLYMQERIAPLYREHGLEWAMTDQFFAETIGQLSAGFTEAGVPLDELDDIAGLLAR